MRAQLKVFSAVCSNFVVVWLVANLAPVDIIVAARNFGFALMFWEFAVETEKILEFYD